MQWKEVLDSEDSIDSPEAPLLSVTSALLAFSTGELQRGEERTGHLDASDDSNGGTPRFDHEVAEGVCFLFTKEAGEDNKLTCGGDDRVGCFHDMENHRLLTDLCPGNDAVASECQMVWNAGNWVSPSGEVVDQSERYRALLPLQWGVCKDSFITLSRDTVTDSLVVIHRHRYPRSGHGSNGEESLRQLHIPFSQPWRRRVRSLLSLSHTNLMPVTDIIMNEAKQELLLVHPYMDGVQPIASALRSYPHLIYRPITSPMMCSIVRGLVDALLFLHKHGIVHGALSPWTVLLTTDNRALVAGPSLQNTTWPLADLESVGGNSLHPSFHTPLEAKDSMGGHCLPTEADDTFALGVLMLAMTWEMCDPLCVELHERAVKLTHRCVAHRMTLMELKASLGPLVDPRNQQERKDRQEGEGEKCSNSCGEHNPLSTVELVPKPQPPVVTGILRRTDSPVLYRTTGLDKWMTSRASNIQRVQRDVVVTLKPYNEDKFDALLRWRVVSITVLFVVSIRRSLQRGCVPLKKIFYHSKETPPRPVPRRLQQHRMTVRRSPVSTSHADRTHLLLPARVPLTQNPPRGGAREQDGNSLEDDW
ncbi:Protein kinase domain containing protein [Trypanosoma brucei equiperdum]|uniref:Protein kinase domain containing protein n=1 Tax=Trypanosoma brucei equiperdum TaxID=630700 RepID=A0A3L6L3N6_9TRYP|nr:Protein kinase domain containing protein [Trypanosoma brucei equiperdum]